MGTIPWEELNKPRHLRKPKYRGSAFVKPRPAKTAPDSSPAVPAKVSQPAELRTAPRTEIARKYVVLEPQPLSVYDDNPVLNEFGAAHIVGVSAELLKKWRQRNQGPDYIQYGPGGTICYELSVLMAFRAAHRVKVGSKQ